MILSNIDISHGASNLGSIDERAKDTSAMLPVSDSEITSSDLNSDRPVRLRSDQESFNTRQSLNAKLNSIAKGIRTADRAMGQVASHIADIKAQLNTIVKHYPPFLAGSDERVEMERSFDAFKSLVDKLTLPPKDDDPLKVKAGLANNSEAGLFEAHIGDDGLVITNSGHEEDAAQINLDIPLLPEHATDEELDAVIKKLSDAEADLNKRRASLFSDAGTISALVKESSIITKINPSYGEDLKAEEMEESSAELRSMEIKGELKAESACLTASDAQIMQLLR